LEVLQIVRTVPGFDDLSAKSVLSDIDVGMSRYPSNAHLLSRASMCPRNDGGAGKRRSTRMRTLYQDLAADHFDRRHKTAFTGRLVQPLQNLGIRRSAHSGLRVTRV
jgi:hypothetical protein